MKVISDTRRFRLDYVLVESNNEKKAKIDKAIYSLLHKELSNKIEIIYFSINTQRLYDIKKRRVELSQKHHARWIIYGEVYRAKSVNLYLFDSTEKHNEIKLKFKVDNNLNLSNAYRLNEFYYIIASENNYFIKKNWIDKSVSKNRRLAVLEFDINKDIIKDFKNIKNDIINIISKDVGNKINIIQDKKFKYAFLKPRRDYSSKERLKKICKLLNVNWLIYGQIRRYKDEFRLKYHLFSYDDNRYLSSSEIKSTSYDDLINNIKRKINSLYSKISDKEDYFLYKNDNVKYVMEYNYFGPIPDKILQPFVSGLKLHNNFLFAGTLFTVAKFDQYGNLVNNFGEKGGGKGQYVVAMKVDVAVNGDIYILDTLNNKILILDKNGIYKKEFFIDTPHIGSIAVLKDLIYCTPRGGNKIIIYNKRGKVLKEILYSDVKTGYLTKIKGKDLIGVLCTKEQGYNMKYYNNNYELVKERSLNVSTSDIQITTFREDEIGNIYVLAGPNRFCKIGSDNDLLWMKSKFKGSSINIFNNPMDIECSDDGKEIYIADYMNKRIVKFKEFDNIKIADSEAVYLKLAKKEYSKDRDKFLYYLNSSLSINSDYIPSIIEKGKYYQHTGNFVKAINLFEEVIEIDKNNKVAKENLKKTKISHYVKEAQQSTEKFNRILKKVGPETAKKHYEEAIKNYELALKLYPQDSKIKNKYEKLKITYQKATGKYELPKIEIVEIKFKEVFSAMYKYYNDNPVGIIKIKNTSGKDIDKIYAEVEVKNFMDYPSESRSYRSFKKDDEILIKLYAVFNNKILTITEDTPLNAQITIKYKVSNKEYKISKKQSFNLYNRNAMIWDATEKLSSFITPKDTVVKVYARETIQMFRHSRFRFMNNQLQSAIQLFDSLGVHGMTYVKDPKTPFTKFSKLKSQVDYIQYPRDSLRFKTGDCDDLTVLFCSLLENLGIDTALVTVPGHIFMMFNTEVPEARKNAIANNSELLVIWNGTVWLPVETTIFGRSFIEAWKSASEQFNKYKKSNEVEVIETKKAWQEYVPVTLEDIKWEPKMPKKESIERLFFEDINKIIDRELTKKIGALKKKLKRDKNNTKLNNKIRIMYAKEEKYYKEKKV